MFNFINLTGKRILIVISNESNLSENDKQTVNNSMRQEFKFDIENDCTLFGKYDYSQGEIVNDKRTEELQSVIN